MKVFITLINVKPLEGCQFDPTKIEQAVVQCFIPEKSEKKAAEYLFEVLDELKLEFISEEYFVADYEFDWLDPENAELKEMVDEAKTSGEIVFGEFYQSNAEQ